MVQKRWLWMMIVVISISILSPTTLTVQSQGGVQAQVIPYELNIRETPAGRVLGKLTQNTTLTITGREVYNDDGGNWVFGTALDGSMSGWVLADYLAFPSGFDLNSLPISNATGAGSASTATVAPTVESPVTTVTNGNLIGTTTGAVNFRSGPSLGDRALRVLPARASVVLVARTTDGTWLQVQYNGQIGWVYRPLVRFSGDINGLPVFSSQVVDLAQTSTTETQTPPPPDISGIISVGSYAREIYLRGQARGNRRNVFSKVGDSMTESRYFLYPFGVGGGRLDVHGYLQPVIDFYSGATARTHNSFSNSSLAARGGWTTVDLLDPEKAVPGICRIGETPLACEYRVTRPTVAIIMIGTNDSAIYNNTGLFQTNLETIVKTSIDMGVIPILSTIPNLIWRGALYDPIFRYNDIIRTTARKYNVPLVDYWQSLQGLPGYGLSGDNLHPSIPPTNETGVLDGDGLRYGYNMRNLVTLQALDAVWRQALY